MEWCSRPPLADESSGGLSIFLKYINCSKNCNRAGSESGLPRSTVPGPPPEPPEEEEADTEEEEAVELLLWLM